MTDKPTPTDAELKAMWQLHAADIGGIFGFAHAVLAKWGQPAQAAEPVAYVEVAQSKSKMSMTWWPEPAGFSLPTGRYRLYTTPQPTQTQPVAREPLTPEQRTAAFIRAEKKMQSDVNLSWRHALVDEIEAEHGIKGGQHD